MTGKLIRAIAFHALMNGAVWTGVEYMIGGDRLAGHFITVTFATIGGQIMLLAVILAHGWIRPEKL